MKLSILVLSVPSRVWSAPDLLSELYRQAEGMDVEVLCLSDNKKRSVGAKRNALLGMAAGDYITFVDDDDWVSHDYVESLLGAICSKPDLVVFDHTLDTAGRSKLCRYGVHLHTVDTAELYQGKPTHTHCWKRDIAIQGKFPDRNFAEDSAWAHQLYGLVKEEKGISRVLYYYQFDPDTSETR